MPGLYYYEKANLCDFLMRPPLIISLPCSVFFCYSSNSASLLGGPATVSRHIYTIFPDDDRFAPTMNRLRISGRGGQHVKCCPLAGFHRQIMAYNRLSGSEGRQRHHRPADRSGPADRRSSALEACVGAHSRRLPAGASRLRPRHACC